MTIISKILRNWASKKKGDAHRLLTPNHLDSDLFLPSNTLGIPRSDNTGEDPFAQMSMNVIPPSVKNLSQDKLVVPLGVIEIVRYSTERRRIKRTIDLLLGEEVSELMN